MVQRQPPHDQLLPQHDRNPDGDAGQPDTHARSSSCRTSSSPSTICPLRSSPRSGIFRQSVDYSITNNRAILDYASPVPGDAAAQPLPDGERGHPARAARTRGPSGPNSSRGWRPRSLSRCQQKQSRARVASGVRGLPPEEFERFRDPELRDPRGYILPRTNPTSPPR